MTVTQNKPTRPASITDAFLAQLVSRVRSTGGGTWQLTEVYTGDLLVELPQSTPADIRQAFVDARVAQHAWAAAPSRTGSRSSSRRTPSSSTTPRPPPT